MYRLLRPPRLPLLLLLPHPLPQLSPPRRNRLRAEEARRTCSPYVLPTVSDELSSLQAAEAASELTSAVPTTPS